MSLSAKKSDQELLVGTAEIKITPFKTLQLAGIGWDRYGREILDDLYAKAVVFRLNGQLSAIVSLDLLWVSRRFCDHIREWSKKELGIPAGNVMITATHTHGGPQTREATFDGCHIDLEYLKILSGKTKHVLREAMEALTPAEVSYGSGPTDIAINRRRKVIDIQSIKKMRLKSYMANRPNPQGPHDKIMGILWIKPKTTGCETVLINVACHPSVWRGDMYSADFPGYLGMELSRRLGRYIRTIFIQGFSGNLRSRLQTFPSWRFWPPASWVERAFDRHQFLKDTSPAHLKKIAKELVEDILAVDLLSLEFHEIKAGEVEIKIPMETIPPKSYFLSMCGDSNHILKSYAQYMLKGYEKIQNMSIRLQCIGLYPGICFLGVEGEVFCEYALWLREKWGNNGACLMTIGCCGGMAGYLPDAESLRQGGYEVDRSLILFGLPSRLAATAEFKLKKAFDDLLEKTWTGEPSTQNEIQSE